MINTKRLIGVMAVGWILSLVQVGYGMYDAKQGRWLSLDPVEYTDGMNGYEYVGSQPAQAVDPAGLWKAQGAWKSLTYEGFIISECGDTYSELLSLLPGLDGGLYHALAYATKQIAGVDIDSVPNGIRVNLKSYLMFYEQLLRGNVVKATVSFEMGKFGASHLTARYSAKEDFVNAYFDEDPATGKSLDCWDAAQYVMDKAVIDTLHPGEFNQIGAIPFVEYPKSFSNMPVGNWVRFQNGPIINGQDLYINPKWSPNPDAFRHENAIKVGEDLYWGFPIGNLSWDGWRTEMINAWINNVVNNGRGPDLKRPYDPYNKNHVMIGFNRFLDWARIAKRIFNIRNRS